MSFAEILSEIPRLSFAERQEWVRSAIAVDDAELTAEENALPDARMEDFRRQPETEPFRDAPARGGGCRGMRMRRRLRNTVGEGILPA